MPEHLILNDYGSLEVRYNCRTSCSLCKLEAEIERHKEKDRGKMREYNLLVKENRHLRESLENIAEQTASTFVYELAQKALLVKLWRENK